MLLSTFENSFRQSRRGSAAPKPSSLQSENCGPNSSASRGRSGLERAQFKFKMEASISRVRCSGNGPAKTTGSAEPAGNNSKRESHNRTFPLRSSFHKESPFAHMAGQAGLRGAQGAKPPATAAVSLQTKQRGRRRDTCQKEIDSYQ